MELTEEQQLVKSGVLAGIRRGQPITTIGGYAGTGKTVLASSLADRLPGVAVCAFTGKAAHVLRGKGVERAQTIHSLIYTPQEVVTTEKVTEADGSIRQVTKRHVVYELRSELEVEGVLVDEASMVSGRLFANLCSFGLPLVFIGDHGQLEPIGEDPGLMADPEYRLETIHRNANEIAHFGGHLRRGSWASEWRFVSGAGKRVRMVSPAQVLAYVQRTDQTIVGFNAKRVELNRQYRTEALGQVGNMPTPGDRLIVLRNTRRYRIFNGQQVTAEQVHSTRLIKLRTEDGRALDVDYCLDAFNNPKPEFDTNPDSPVPLDFAYAITCHKAQGSEWGSGLVIEQYCPYWEHPRWTYTAATRFKESVLWTHPKWK